MSSHPSLKVIYEMSVKQFEFVDRTYETLTTRAASMIGWTSFVSTAAIFVQGKLIEDPLFRGLFVGCFSTLAIASLSFALRAYLHKEMEPWPDSLWFIENQAHEEEDDTRLQLMGNIEEAIRKNTRVVNKRSALVDNAVRCLAGLTVAMLLALAGSFLLPGI